jgi:hypothetical protein
MMGDRVVRKRAALAVMQQALAKVLPQLALAQSTARICGDDLVEELAELASKVTELQGRILQAQRYDGEFEGDI